MSINTDGFRLWDEWLNSSLAHLRNAQLLRTLRPTVWSGSSSEAWIHRADLDAWVAGLEPVVRHYDHTGEISGSAAVLPQVSDVTSVNFVRQYAAAAADGASRHAPPEAAAALAASAAGGADGSDRPCRRCGGGSGDGQGCLCCCTARGLSDASSSRSSPCSGPGSIPAALKPSRGGDSACSARERTAGEVSREGDSSSSSGPSDPGLLVRLRLFSLNDYLGLGSHPEVAGAAARAAKLVGMGPRSSALVAGYTHSHRQLEEGLAALKGTEDCLLFPTGFAANLAVMTSLSYAAPPSPSPSVATLGVSGGVGVSGDSSDGGTGLAIFSDELNHASIIDGARLASRGAGGGGGSAVQLHVYRHNDLNHLELLLAASPPGVRRLVVTDSLFSMDGDFADLRGLVELRRRHPFLLAVDEAHATLVCGEGGAGAAEAMGVAHEVDLHVGTLSKAFGALGGFVACSTAMKQLLLNRGRAFVYSTSLPVPVVEAAAAALRVSCRESWRRVHVWSLVRRLQDGLGVPALSPVVPLVVGPERPTLELSSALLARGLHVPAIRPPTVPPGTCRLRVSLSAAHTHDDVNELIHLVRSSDVPLVRLPHLLDPRAALPPPLSWSGASPSAAPRLGGLDPPPCSRL